MHALAKTAAQAEERRDYVDHAIECFQRVRANVPGNPEACLALNELYLEIGERDKLLETMQYGGIKSGRARGAPRGKGRERGGAASALGKRAKADGYMQCLWQMCL